MKELNSLTRRLLAQGYTPEDTPPGMRNYEPLQGGWTYDPQTRRNMTFETPCGLLVSGARFNNGYMSFHGIDWRPENDNPVVTCPRFPAEPCPLRHPLLHKERYSSNPDDLIFQCNCHPTTRPYTFEGSVEEAHKQVWQEAEERWNAFERAHKGRVCRHQSHYGRTSKTWRTHYDPLDCAQMNLGCTHCGILGKDLVPQKGNVFYDVKKTWVEKGNGLFQDEKKVSIEKGCQLLPRPVSMTICEAIVQFAQRRITHRVMDRYWREMFFDKTLQIEVLNFRAAWRDTRDILQDLQDVADGVRVTHAADDLKAAKEQKTARRKAAQERKVQWAERLVLSDGWDNLEQHQKHRVYKLLGPERIEALLKQKEAFKPVQIGLF